MVLVLDSVNYNNLGLQRLMGMFCVLRREGREKMEFQAMRYVSVQYMLLRELWLQLYNVSRK